jgi:hypothetical protein
VADGSGAVVGAVSVATLSARLQRDRVRTALAAIQVQVTRLTRRLADVERARARS